MTLTDQMLSGIAYLHSENLIHRDLKSSNVMLSVKGEIKLSTHSQCYDSLIQLILDYVRTLVEAERLQWLGLLSGWHQK